MLDHEKWPPGTNPNHVKPVYQHLANFIQARINCAEAGNTEWFVTHQNRIDDLMEEHMPHGGGFDDGVHLDLMTSTGERIEMWLDFHTMDEYGCYSGWQHFGITILPSLLHGFLLELEYPERDAENPDDNLDDYIADVIHNSLSEPVNPYAQPVESVALKSALAAQNDQR